MMLDSLERLNKGAMPYRHNPRTYTALSVRGLAVIKHLDYGSKLVCITTAGRDYLILLHQQGKT
jgi:hypothetical protein